MTMNLNSRAWHIHITKKDGRFFFDIDEASGLYYTEVAENDFACEEGDPNSINHYENLTIEATIINDYIKEFVLGDKIKPQNEETTSNHKSYPFADVETCDVHERNQKGVTENRELERSVYCYRQWNVGTDLKILVRCQIHSGEILEVDDEEEVLTTTNFYALNEYSVSLYFRKICLNQQKKS